MRRKYSDTENDQPIKVSTTKGLMGELAIAMGITHASYKLRKCVSYKTLKIYRCEIMIPELGGMNQQATSDAMFRVNLNIQYKMKDTLRL